MILKKILVFSLFLVCFKSASQNFTGVYKIGDLLDRIQSKDTTYIVNFWASWCKPCIQELPSFDSLNVEYSNQKVKVLLVCLDFKEDLETKVIPFLIKKKIESECVLLDEINGNEFIDKISTSWTGAIPATLFKKGNKESFVENKLQFNLLLKQLKEFNIQ